MLPIQWNCIPVIAITIVTTTMLIMLLNGGYIVEAGVVPESHPHSLKSVGQKLHADIMPDLNLGLYNQSDKVKILTQRNFDREVRNRNHSILIEFYNSYCGHCRKFAPHYKNLANRLYGWRDIMPVAALDCADDENNDLCRFYEIMAYPTLRYFEPFFKPGPGNFGIPLNITSFDVIEQILAKLLSEENRNRTDGNTLKYWPNFDIVSDNIEKLYNEKSASHLALLYDMDNTKSTVAQETILHLSRWPDIEIRRVNDSRIFNINDTEYKVLIIDSDRKIYPYRIPQNTTDAYVAALKTFLKLHDATERPDTDTKDKNDKQNNYDVISSAYTESLSNNAKGIIEYVKSNKHMVYQADLERAIYVTIYNEIPKAFNISGPKLIALQRFLNVLDKYNPLGSNGRTFLNSLNAFANRQSNNGAISGEDFEQEIRQSEALYSPIFSSNQYIGCIGSVRNARGFTCSLWQLFHYLTVQAAEKQSRTQYMDNNPLEVLNAMHGYIKYFFGCTECSEHFQEMALRRNMSNVSSKDEAILWLWGAHNEVNQRLAGDATEDPVFPKIQFPSYLSCLQCYYGITNASTANRLNNSTNGPIWHVENVLKFLKLIHNPLYINRYGVNNIAVLPYRTPNGRKYDHEFESANGVREKLRSKRMITNVFNDLDIRMGILLYGFCIVMLVLAFKLFTLRGSYRKKSYYCHDMLGKA